MPAWMATALNSPDVQVRLHALDRWVQDAPVGSVGPLLRAMEDEDKRVQARALALIEQDWVRAQACGTGGMNDDITSRAKRELV